MLKIMINKHFLIFSLSLAAPFLTALSGQSPLGLWKTIDDETGEPKSHIKIYQENDKLYGKVVKLLKTTKQTTCKKCPEPHTGKPIEGLRVMWDLEKDGDEWDGGEIMDPSNGKIYNCKIYLEEPNTLKVRGYIGFSAFGRTQEWKRIK
jgi:uncharacterized protein (DUF2147 family)